MLKHCAFAVGFVLGKLGSKPKPEPDPPFDAWSIPSKDVLGVICKLGVSITLLADNRLYVTDPNAILVGPNFDGFMRHVANIQAILQEQRRQDPEETLLHVVGKAGTDVMPPLLAEVHRDRQSPDGMSTQVYAVDDKLRVERLS